MPRASMASTVSASKARAKSAQSAVPKDAAAVSSASSQQISWQFWMATGPRHKGCKVDIAADLFATNDVIYLGAEEELHHFPGEFLFVYILVVYLKK